MNCVTHDKPLVRKTIVLEMSQVGRGLGRGGEYDVVERTREALVCRICGVVAWDPQTERRMPLTHLSSPTYYTKSPNA